MPPGVLLAIGLGTLMTAFESSAVGATLPTITHAFHATMPAGKGIVTGYLLALCVSLLPAGRLGDRFGHRRLYLIGLTLSIPSAIGCALGTSLAAITIFRTIGGIGAAFILANGIPILTAAVGTHKTGRYLGLLTSMAYIGLITGSLLSGWLQSLPPGWRAVYIATLSLTLFALVLALILLPHDPTRTRAKATAPVKAPSPMKVVAPVKAPNPMKAPNPIKAVAPSTPAIATLLLAYTALYSLTFIFPFYLDALGLQKATIGYILAIRPIVTAVITPASGALTDRYGARQTSLLGIAILCLAFAIPLLTGNNESLPIMILSLAGIGLGMGSFLSPNHTFIMQNAAKTHKGIASSTLSLIRNLGMLIGTALSGISLPRSTSSSEMTGHPAAHSAFAMATAIIGLALVIGVIDQRKAAIKQLRPA